jgi:iron(III) transport system substrate-binding protein
MEEGSRADGAARVDARGRRERAGNAGRRMRGAGALATALLVGFLGPLACSRVGEGEAGAAPGGGDATAQQGERRGDDADGPLTVYAARPEGVLGPLLDEFGDEHDVELAVRYGAPQELLDAVFQQVTNGGPDVFLAPDGVTMGALSRRGLLRELPMDLVALVPARFAAVDQRHDWVGLTARPRAVVYDRTRVRPETLPRSLEGVRDRAHRAAFGIAPTSPSFTAHLAVYRVAKGEEALDSLLAGIRDNQPKAYGSDGEVVQGVLRGEVRWGLVDLGAAARDLAAAPQGRLAIARLDQGDVSGFVDASAGGVLSEDPRGVELLRYLLGTAAQERLGRAAGEYPLAAGVAAPDGLPKLETLSTPAVDFADVAAVLGETQRALRRVGLVK